MELLIPDSMASASAASWVSSLRQEIDAQRPGNAWFAATLHPCLGRRADLEISIAASQKPLTRFDALVAQRLFGKSWRRKYALVQRPWGVLLAQDGVEGVHFHGLIAVPEEYVSVFLVAAPVAWRAVAPRGTLDLPRLATQEAWAGYVTRLVHLGKPIAFAFLPCLSSSSSLPFKAPSEPRPPPAPIFPAALAA